MNGFFWTNVEKLLLNYRVIEAGGLSTVLKDLKSQQYTSQHLGFCERELRLITHDMSLISSEKLAAE